MQAYGCGEHSTGKGTMMNRFSRNPLVSKATLESGAILYCSIPGGKPRFTFSTESMVSTDITDAPICDSHAEFVRFVNDRFGE